MTMLWEKMSNIFIWYDKNIYKNKGIGKIVILFYYYCSASNSDGSRSSI